MPSHNPDFFMNKPIKPQDEMRLFLGFLAQPFVAAALAFVTFPLVDLSGRAIYGGAPADPMDAAVALAFGTGVAALIVTLLGAWPAAMWVIKRRAVTLKESLRFGLLLANIPVVLMTLATGGGYGLAGFARAVLFASLLGLSGAAVFWAISIRGRFDSSVP
jgi:hypothetical protein